MYKKGKLQFYDKYYNFMNCTLVQLVNIYMKAGFNLMTFILLDKFKIFTGGNKI